MAMQDVFTGVFSAKAPNGGKATVDERANAAIIHRGTLVYARVSAFCVSRLLSPTVTDL